MAFYKYILDLRKESVKVVEENNIEVNYKTEVYKLLLS